VLSIAGKLKCWFLVSGLQLCNFWPLNGATAANEQADHRVILLAKRPSSTATASSTGVTICFCVSAHWTGKRANDTQHSAFVKSCLPAEVLSELGEKGKITERLRLNVGTCFGLLEMSRVFGDGAKRRTGDQAEGG